MANSISTSGIETTDWYFEDFIYNSVSKFLKENGYKVQKENSTKEKDKTETKIIASKFFKKEIIEVKGFPNYYYSNSSQTIEPAKNSYAKNWFTEALFNSFINFSLSENAEVAIALPNVARYQAIIKKLNDYFTVNDLYFRIYLVNEDGSVDISNLNEKYCGIKP